MDSNLRVWINSDKPKIKREMVKCDQCYKSILTIRSYDENICRPCWKSTKQKSIWCMYCEMCGHLTLEDEYKTCSECNKIVGPCCGRLYHCQSVECTCKHCFDYECEDCGDSLEDHAFVSDGDIDIQPLCNKCKELRKS